MIKLNKGTLSIWESSFDSSRISIDPQTHSSIIYTSQFFFDMIYANFILFFFEIENRRTIRNRLNNKIVICQCSCFIRYNMTRWWFIRYGDTLCFQALEWDKYFLLWYKDLFYISYVAMNVQMIELSSVLNKNKEKWSDILEGIDILQEPFPFHLVQVQYHSRQ